VSLYLNLREKYQKINLKLKLEFRSLIKKIDKPLVCPLFNVVLDA
jgi:hypothetical protein